MATFASTTFGRTGSTLELIEMMYAAVQDAALWPMFLDSFADAAGGRQTFLFSATGVPTIPGAILNNRSDPQAMQDFVTHYGALNVFSEPCDLAFQPGETRYGHLVVSDEELERSEFYNDFFKRYDMHHTYGLKIPVLEDGFVYLSCQRPKRWGGFGEPDGELMQSIKPHLYRAFTLQQQLEKANAKAVGMERALDAFGHGVLGLDATGQVVLCNQTAESMTRSGDAFWVGLGRLRAAFPEQDAQLQELVKKASAWKTGFEGTSAGGVAPRGGAMLLERRSGKQALRVTVSPYTGSVPGKMLAALVYVSDPAAKPASRAESLRAMFRLTPAESRVAELLGTGLEVRQVAEVMGVTFETARSHLKLVMGKTGARRQSELVRMMLALPG